MHALWVGVNLSSGHYKDRDLPKGEEYTPAEALTAHYTSGAQAGTYKASGTTLTLERTVHLRPERVG